MFTALIAEHANDLSKAVPAFAKAAKPAGDAIAELSYSNYVEMRSHTASTWFLFRKRIEAWLHFLVPSLWTPLYVSPRTSPPPTCLTLPCRVAGLSRIALRRWYRYSMVAFSTYGSSSLARLLLLQVR